jgi:hypothetical protein
LVELVEQLREDGDELDPLEQRLPVVLGQVQQAGGEVERWYPKASICW